jgi:predicted anti-sigma-YlaC factor YlaD
VNCEARQERLEQIAFEGRLESIVDEDRAHMETCEPCRSQFSLLRQLIGESRDAQPAPLSRQLLVSVDERATRALRATHSNPIFQWEIAAPLAVALLALPIAIGQGWLWAYGLSALLDPWLPTSVLTGMTIFYAASAALTLGGLYGSLPFAIAYANRKRLEAS